MTDMHKPTTSSDNTHLDHHSNEAEHHVGTLDCDQAQHPSPPHDPLMTNTLIGLVRLLGRISARQSIHTPPPHNDNQRKAP